jgi:epoxyqueuosine reductase
VFRSAEITAAIKQAATGAGFDLVGIAPVEDPPELEYFPRWIAAGYAGEMKYLEARDQQGRLKRASLAHAAPWARSVVVCAINYNTARPYSHSQPHSHPQPHSNSTQAGDPGETGAEKERRGWISRYAWGKTDYHDSLMRRLREVEAAVRRISGAEDLLTQCYVDTGPIVERVVAKYAGVGWIGKNTCIINQTLGSWLFLGVILTSLELKAEESKADLPAPDRCGSCTRCIDACPTDAFVGPYRLDSNKCIAYLTIEKRGAIAEELREGMGRHVFGCDICQDVCPWNRKAPATLAEEFQAQPQLVNPALEWLAEMSAQEFNRTFRGSPVKRAKRAGLRRNAVIAMGNSGNAGFLPQLRSLANDEDKVVAESAEWAMRKLGSSV